MKSALVPFTPEELAELAAFDEEIDGQIAFDREEDEAARQRDWEIKQERRDPKSRKKANRDKQYYQEHRGEYRATRQSYQDSHKNEIKAKWSKWYANNKETYLERKKAVRASESEQQRNLRLDYHKAHYEANKERYAERFRQYQASHKEQRAAYMAMYRLTHQEQIREYRHKQAERKKELAK